MSTRSISGRALAPIVALVASSFVGDAIAAGALPVAYVNIKGSDANPCTNPAPCRTLRQALNNAVAPGGTIYLMTPGNFGTATISFSVNIIAKGGAPAGVNAFLAGSTGLTIAAGANGQVTLQGLTVDGGANAAKGVSIRSAQSVVLKDCMLRNFDPAAGVGLYVKPTTPVKLTVEDTMFLTSFTGPTYTVHLEASGANTITAAFNRTKVIGAEMNLVGAVKASITDSIANLKIGQGAAAALANTRGAVSNAGTVALSKSAVELVDLGGQVFSFGDNVMGPTPLNLNAAAFK